MDNTVQLDTLSPACLQYACSDNMIHVARGPMTSLIDIHPVFTENLVSVVQQEPIFVPKRVPGGGDTQVVIVKLISVFRVFS